jgi:Rrf2 family protein
MKKTGSRVKLSTRARYALRMMLDVARYAEPEKPVSLAAVSKRIGVSRGYLEQLAPALRNARLIRGVSGRYAGYRLALPRSDISIGDTVKATIGPIYIVDCVEDPKSCLRSTDCECRMVQSLINHRVAEVLGAHSLSDLLNPEEAFAFDISSDCQLGSGYGGAIAQRAGKSVQDELNAIGNLPTGEAALDLCADVMVDTVAEHLKSDGTSLEVVSFVTLDSREYEPDR